MITLLGESFLLNSLCNNEFETINQIAVGTGSKKPQKQDLRLGAEKSRKSVQPTVDLTNRQLLLNVQFEASEIQGTTEIGVFAGDTLISRDIYDEIDLSDLTGVVNLTYTFDLQTGGYRSDWIKVDNYNHVYVCREPNKVTEVYEESTETGYRRINTNIQEVDDTPASYFYIQNTKSLYIHTSTGKAPENIIVKTR